MVHTPDHFVVVHRNIEGAPVSVLPHDRRPAACVARCSNISRAYLDNSKVQAALHACAKKIDELEPNAWYKDRVHGYGSTEGAVLAFIELTRAVFFIISIDDSLRNPDKLAHTAVKEWDGPFDPRNHCINLNGRRFNDMVAAMTRSINSNNPGGYDIQQLQTFVFIFANSIFREICNLLVVFLTRGRPLDPAHLRTLGVGHPENTAWTAGRHVEITLLGGTLICFRDPDYPENQSGIPYICINEHGRRISRPTIDAALNHQYHSPYLLEGPSVSVHNMATLGKYHPPDQPTDPMNWAAMHQFKKHRHSVQDGSEADHHRLFDSVQQMVLGVTEWGPEDNPLAARYQTTIKSEERE